MAIFIQLHYEGIGLQDPVKCEFLTTYLSHPNQYIRYILGMEYHKSHIIGSFIIRNCNEEGKYNMGGILIYMYFHNPVKQIDIQFISVWWW